MTTFVTTFVKIYIINMRRNTVLKRFNVKRIDKPVVSTSLDTPVDSPVDTPAVSTSLETPLETSSGTPLSRIDKEFIKKISSTAFGEYFVGDFGGDFVGEGFKEL